MTSRFLDNPRVVSSLDPSGMLAALDNSPGALLQPVMMKSLGGIPDEKAVENIVFGGMGGSAIAADVTLDWLSDRINVPCVIVRDSRLPRFAGRSTLVIALSYSGETTETLALYRSARSHHCQTVGISTGGRLLEYCRREQRPFLRLRSSVSPRAALYQLVGACSMVIRETGLVGDVETGIREASLELSRLHPFYHMRRRMSSNNAKRMALSLKDQYPVIYALQRMSSVARRFKNQLNENSKIPAKYDLLPESGHNEVEAWRKARGMRPIFIRDTGETKFEFRIIEGFKRTIREASRISGVDVRVNSRSRLGRFLGPIFFLDYVSVYLAFLNGVDPTATFLIREFRRNIRVG